MAPCDFDTEEYLNMNQYGKDFLDILVSTNKNYEWKSELFFYLGVKDDDLDDDPGIGEGSNVYCNIEGANRLISFVQQFEGNYDNLSIFISELSSNGANFFGKFITDRDLNSGRDYYDTSIISTFIRQSETNSKILSEKFNAMNYQFINNLFFILKHGEFELENTIEISQEIEKILDNIILFKDVSNKFFRFPESKINTMPYKDIYRSFIKTKYDEILSEKTGNLVIRFNDNDGSYFTFPITQEIFLCRWYNQTGESNIEYISSLNEEEQTYENVNKFYRFLYKLGFTELKYGKFMDDIFVLELTM